MKQICKFHKSKDFVQTKPNLSVNLAQALETKAIPSTGTEVEHNEIETSDGIGMRVRDNFEAIEAQRAYTAQGKAAAKAEKEAKASSENKSTPAPQEGAN